MAERAWAPGTLRNYALDMAGTLLRGYEGTKEARMG